MESKWTGLREIRERIQPGLGSEDEKALRLEQAISDLDRCLKGDATSERWQELNIELTNKKGDLLHMKRRLAGRTPQMESWADPLPG